MSTSNLPQSQITFTPDNKLVVHYPINTLKKRVFAYMRLTILILFILTFVSALVLDYFDFNIGYFNFIFLPYILLQNSNFLKKSTVEKVTLIATGFKYKYYDKKSPEIIELENLSYVDIKVKLLEDSTVELDIDDFLIYFDDVEKLPLVIDNIASTWRLQYYDTIHVDDNQEILTYISKVATNFKADSRLKIEDKPLSITFRDDLIIQKYIRVNKQTGEIFSHQNSKGIKLLNSNYSIQIAAFSNLGIFYKESEIRINLVDKNGGLNNLFTSEKRHKDEVVTTYRDVELIYDTLKALPILENMVIEKLFR
ncbi:MAG: hypothetical protein AB8G11_01465 [Saprospiraceae bacterium]